MEKLFPSIKVLIIGLLLGLAYEVSACTYTFKLYDTYGDSWNGGYINIKVNGVVVASNVTLSSGSGPYIYSLVVNHGDVISTDYYSGSWANENYYDVFDNDNNFVKRDGCNDYSCTPSGGFIANANCALRDVTMLKMVTPATSCALSSAELVKVRVKNTAVQQIDTLYFSYCCPDISPNWYSDTLYQTLYSGDSLEYTFSTTVDLSILGTYSFIVVVKAANDQGPGNDTLSAEVTNLPYITTFPYLEGFEAGTGGWLSGGNNNSWELGVPDGSVIDTAATDTMAWVTNLTGNYNQNEQSWVVSPCFNFTGLTNIVFEMNLWYETYYSDGAAIQYTTDNIDWYTLGNWNEPVNWYNNDWVQGLGPFNPITNPQGWTGSTSGWIHVRHFLPPVLAGASWVRFRIVFGSTNYNNNYEGVAFDDVHIYQPPPMTYDFSDAGQPNTSVVGKGMQNQEIIGLRVVTNSSTNPLAITDIRYNSTGTTNTADIDAARLYYSEDISFYNPHLQFGQTVTPLSPFGFQDTLYLMEGENFFWLVYDVDSNATSGNFLDAEVDSIKINGIWYVPFNNNPLGNRQIQPPMAGTYVIDQTGNGDYLSLGDAIFDLDHRGVNGPVILNMLPGIYNERPEFRPVFGSSPTNTITIKSSTNDSTSVTIQDSAVAWEENWVFYFENASNYILKHLHIKPLSNTLARAINFRGACTDIIVENCILEGASNVQINDTWLAIVFAEDPVERITFQNNRLLNGSYGIYSASWGNSSSYMLISENIFDNQYTTGAYLESHFRPVVYANQFNGSQNPNYYGIYGYNLSDSFRIMANRLVLLNDGIGIYLYDSYGDTNYLGAVINNFVSVAVQGNGSAYGIYTGYLYDVVIMHNSINLHSGMYPGGYPIYLSGSYANCYVINNIFCNAAGGGSIRFNNPGGLWGDYNNYYYTGPDFGNYNYNGINTLQSWQNQSGFDSHSQVANPMFFSNTDLHTIALAVSNKGMGGSGLLVDIDGEPRDTLNPDIGADEFPQPTQEASFEGFTSPLGDCGLGSETVTIRIANNGVNAITGTLTASYQILGGALVSQAVPGTILPGDTLDFSFATPANLTVIGNDSTFILHSWIALVGDPIQYNDSGETQVWSGYVPPSPVAVNTTVNYGTQANLSVVGAGTMKWYSSLSSTQPVASGSSYTTPLLYDTTTYYVEAWAITPTPGGTNIAPQAIASHSSGGTSSYGPANYNDNVIPAYPNTPWGWVSTNGWIELTWPAPVTFNGVKFYKSDRPMYTCTFEYWDGVQYIPFYYYNSSAIDDSVAFPEVTSSKLRFYNIAGSNNPNHREIKVFVPEVSGCPSIRIPVTANVTAFPAIDAGIVAIDQPAGQVPAGQSTEVKVVLKNYGTSNLLNTTIYWKLSNTVQGSYAWTGNLPHGNQTVVTIDTFQFAPGLNCITAYTSLPNGVPDNFNSNDTFTSCFTACMSGTYTIGPAATGTYHFNNFNAAVNALAAAGVCGPVIFDVYPGTYTEQVAIPAIPGAGSGSAITFRGTTPDSSLVILQYTATSSGSNYTLRFNGTSWITFQHITINANGTSYGRVVEFYGNSSNINILNCSLKTSITSTSSNFTCVYSPSSYTSHNVNISNSRLEGGYYSIYWYGPYMTPNNTFIISNNIFTEFYRSAAYIYYTNNVFIESNHLTNRASSSNLYVIYLNDCYGTGRIQKNRINAQSSGTFYGLYLYDVIASSSSPFLIANNFITYQGNPNGTAWGIYSYYNDYLDILYNSVRMGGGSIWDGIAYYQDYGGSNIRVMNNIFSNFNGGYAMYAYGTNAISQCNYNDYYTTGSTLNYWSGDFSTFSNYQSAVSYLGFDGGSQNLLPPFTSPTNLALNSTILSGLGGPQPTVTDDIFGNSRTTTPTIGAHEVPLIPNDAGVVQFITPTPQIVVTEGDLVPVEVVIKNFGLDPITSVLVSYRANNGTPVQATYTGYISPNQTDTFQLPDLTTPAGNIQLCAWTTLGGDINLFNDTSCMGYYAFSNIDAHLIQILPLQEGCGPGLDTVRVEITNDATALLPAGYTVSYRRGTDPAVTETVNTAIPVGDTIIYSFSTLLNLNTSADTTYTITAWVDALDDNLPVNDTATRQVVSLATPPPPAAVSPVTISYGNSAILDANTLLYNEWYKHPTNPKVASGSVYQTPVLYDTTTYYAQTFFGNPAQDFQVGTGTTQNSSTGYPNPYGHYYWGNKEQYLILASELTTAGIMPGDMTALAFNVITPGSMLLQNFSLKLGHTTQTSMSSPFLTGLTEVYTSPSYQQLAGWNTHTFQTPFNWDGTSNLVVEVCFNNSSYTSHGIISMTQPGFTSTINTHSDATAVCGYTSGNTYSIRPVIRFTAFSLGCGSGRVPVVVNVNNIPPLGKPNVIPTDMQVSLQGCNSTDSRNIRIKNIGTAPLQYTAFGGPHIKDTTSTQYYNSSTYPDTTTHVFTTIPSSVDSLYLDITINGTYSSSAAYASLIIEGTFIGVIPDGNIGNGQDITVTYAIGGTQLENWLYDGELKIRIGNSSSVSPWTGTRMHRIRAYTKAAPWLTMPTITGLIPVGDSLVLQAQFSGAGLKEGTYHTSIPLAFNHPGYPWVKIPVVMTLDGEPVFQSAACVNFNPVFQFGTTSEYLRIYNTGCDELNITNITPSDTAFTVSLNSASIDPFDSLDIQVVFNPKLLKTYNDSLMFVTNAGNQTVCLTGQSISPPLIAFGTDTVSAVVQGCNDTVPVLLTILNQGNAPLTWQAFPPQNYILISPDTGTIPPLSQQQITVSFISSNLVAGTYMDLIGFTSNDPTNPTPLMPYRMDLIGLPNFDINTATCLSMDSLMVGASSSKSFTVNNLGCDTLEITSLVTGTAHFSVAQTTLQLFPFSSAPVTVYFHPLATGIFEDTITMTSNDGIRRLCITGKGLPAPDIALSQNSLIVNITNCNDSVIVPVQIQNQGQANLNWAIGYITGSYAGIGSTNGMKVGVYNSSSITNLLNTTTDIDAFNIGTMDYATISQYDVVMNIRGSNINQADVLTYIQNGGTWIGEWSSNYYPFQWGAISGSVPNNGTSGTYGATVMIPNHYLAQNINWAAMPYGSNPVDYMRDLRNLNDPQAQVIVRANHYSYPNNPALVEKQYGNGKIIIFNWDYNDAPTYNSVVSNMIIQVVRYGGMKAQWLTADPTSGTAVPQGSNTINVKFNALGLNSGTYNGKIFITSNDPVTPTDSMVCTLNVIGSAGLQFAQQGCVEFDTIIQGFTANDTLKIYNTGCDTLLISSITHNLSVYTLSASSMSILPYDSALLAVTFAPNAAQVFADTLVFTTNAGIHTYCVTGVGIDAPVISISPPSFSHTFTTCNDSVILPLKIFNTGIGDLKYSMTNLFGTSFNQTSSANYSTSGATTQHNFSNVPVVSDTMTVIVTVNGDFDYGSEYASLMIEGTNIGIIPDVNPSNGTNITAQYTFTGAQLLSWIGDGNLAISVINSGDVDHWSGLVSLHQVQVIINGIPWITVDKTADTVVTGDSSVVYVTMKTAGLNNGTYQSTINILSNDPANQVIAIPCTMVINGPAGFALSEPCLYFGPVMQYANKKDTLYITNNGCSNLVISSIYTGLSQFSLSASYASLQPGQQFALVVTFAPTAVGSLTDNIYMVTGSGTQMVCLTGQGVDASILGVSPSQFNKTINACNDTITDILQVQNLGTGNLTYQVYGGRGLSGDSTVLVIRDSDPWGVNVGQYLSTNFGVTPQVITSSQIAATNFGDYDLVITVGNQSASYYNTLTAQAAKFSTFANSGGIVLYMLANYQVNNITLAGNANMVYGNSESQNMIVHAGHPIVQGLTNPLNGSNANSCYLTNLPPTAKVITCTNISALPTTAEYEMGSGLVIATGMLYEYHSTLTGFNINTMMHNALAYALSNIGKSPSWLSFAYVADTLFGISNTNVTVKFNSTDIPNGVYNSNIIVYSNDPVNPQMLVPCTLTVNGPAQIATSVTCLTFDTVVQNGTDQQSLMIYNTGCANLSVTSVGSPGAQFTASPAGPFQVAAGDSQLVTVTFHPTTLGQFNNTLNIISGLGTTSICLNGVSINPPYLQVTPASFNVTLNNCADTLVQQLKIKNIGSGNAIYRMLGLFGTDIDQMSNIPFNSNGASTLHNFPGIPANIDSLVLEITLSGDFDMVNEYAELIVEGVNMGQIDDGNVSSGTPFTDIIGFGGSQLATWLADGMLSITIQNAATVDHWSGLNSYHNVRLRVAGNHWINLSSLTDTVHSGDSTLINVMFHSTHMSVGTHTYNLVVGSNDPTNPNIAVPCTLTVNGTAAWWVQSALDFNSILVGTSNVRNLIIENTGCDTLKITNVQSSEPLIVPQFTSFNIMPHSIVTLAVTFNAASAGTYQGTLQLTSNIGTTTVSTIATALPASSIQLSQTSFTSNLACELTETKNLTIKNVGQAPLVYNFTYNPAIWLTVTPNAGTVPVGDSVQVQLNFDKTGIMLGTHLTTYTIQSNDPLNPALQITCTLQNPNLIIPVNLGPDQQLCGGQNVVLHAGGIYTSYLWDNNSTDSVRTVSASGTYHITVIDANSCTSSDTVQIYFYTVPVADAGIDTAVCTGSDFVRAAAATGTIQVAGEKQIGTYNGASGSNSVTPFATGYLAARTQLLFRNYELQGSGFPRGLIQTLSFNILSLGDPSMTDFTISMGTTLATTLGQGFQTGLTQVYHVPLQNLTMGWNTLTLDVPFFYDGMDHLVVEICFTNYTYNYNYTVQYSNIPFVANRKASTYAAGVNGCSLTSNPTYSYQRPNIKVGGLIDQGMYKWTGPGSFLLQKPELRLSQVNQSSAGFYTLHVDNGIGCVSTDAFNLALAPVPQVNAGPDTFVYEGLSTMLNGNATGGTTPYSIQWIPGNSLSDPTLFNPVASPVQTTPYVLYVTGANGCTGFDTVKVTVVPRYNVLGTLSYNNAAYTPLGNTWVYLKNQSGIVLDSCVTDNAGAFLFNLYPPGQYSLAASATKPWGGVNSTDALVVQRHVINLNPITGLRLQGADVNNSATVSSTDALMILRRTLALDNAFAKGDWVSETPAFAITSGNVVKNLQALAVGDVNGSYVPPTMRQVPVVEIKQDGYTALRNGVAEIPVRVSTDLQIGALTLFTDLPEGVTSVAVTSDLPGLMYHQTGNQLKIGWSDEKGYILRSGDQLLSIVVEIPGNVPLTPFLLKASVESEFADLRADVLDPVILTAPALREGNPASQDLSAVNQPNPFREKTIIRYILPESGRVKVELFDAVGRNLGTLKEISEESGEHTLEVDAIGLPAGIYQYRITLETRSGSYRAQNTMIIIR